MKLQQPTDTEPRAYVSMVAQRVYASGYPDSWTVMDDLSFRFVAYRDQWYPQMWPESVLRRFDPQAPD